MIAMETYIYAFELANLLAMVMAMNTWRKKHGLLMMMLMMVMAMVNTMAMEEEVAGVLTCEREGEKETAGVQIRVNIRVIHVAKINGRHSLRAGPAFFFKEEKEDE